MDNKTIILILTIVAAAVFAGLLVSIPFRTKKMMANAGKLLLPLPNGVPVRVIAIFVVCAVLIAIVPLRNFAIYIAAILLAAALLGAEITVREAAGIGHAGVYEKMIVSGTYSILYETIETLPTLSYEDDPETLNVDKQNLQIILKNGNGAMIPFGSVELRKQAVDLILQQEKRLRP